MTDIYYTDARLALRDGVENAPAVIAWCARTTQRPGRWIVYNPAVPVAGSTPEVLCLTRGIIFPLTETGERVLHSALNATT
jgi:hypothetical protein